MDTTKRIKKIIEHFELSPSVFADEIEVQRSSISHILSGRNKPSLDLIQKVIKRFPEINPVWLLTGKGEMKQLDLFGDQENKPSEDQKITNVNHNKSTPEPASEDKFTNVTNTQPYQSVPPPAPQAATPPPPPEPPKAPEEPPKTQRIEQDNSMLPFLGSKGKKIEKIVIFYDDKTFSVYNPE
ncbi:helix-turn-helix transcriptional regulator [Cytophagaceae bacterium ABcell3]|nr:helix-turn-helix transcriptional regulator [Cytophagaceae bacterium ABcell3]